MRLLHFNKTTPVKERLISIKKELFGENGQEHVEDILMFLIDYCREFPAEYTDMMNMENKLREALFWWGEFNDWD